MRRLPSLGPIESFFASEKAAEPAVGNESAMTKPSTDDGSADPGSTGAPARNPEDTISLDGVSLDEILAQSDAPDEASRAPDESANDTGEWEAIEDMLSPDVMLREKNQKKRSG